MKRKSTITASLSPGFAYFFNRHCAMDIFISGFSYSRFMYKDSDNDFTQINLNLNSLAPNLGIRYHFGN